MTNDVFGEVQNELINYKVGQPSQFTGFTPIYVVITPPGCYDINSQGDALGWNQYDTPVVFPPLGNSGAQLGAAEVIWCFDPSVGDGSLATLSDQFSVSLGHELTEIMTDPHQDATGVTVGSAPNIAQICDNEAELLSYRLDGPTGYLVQSFWSQQNGAFIVPDGNSYQFAVSGGSQTQFTEGSSSTLTINGGQAGAYTSDTITLSNANGAVTATLDGQTVQFDPGAISNVVINATSVSTTVNLDGTWNATDSLTINDNGNNPVTINVSPDAHNLTQNFKGSSITVSDPHHQTVLNLDNQTATLNQSWVLGSTTYGLDGSTLVTYSSGVPEQVNVNTGLGADTVDIEGTSCPTHVNFDGAGNVVSLTANFQNLMAIGNPVYLNGSISTLSFDDRANSASENVSFENGEFSENYVAPIYYSGLVTTVDYYAGTGSDILSAAPNSKNLEDLVPDLAIYGGSGKDSLTINDTGAHVGE